MKLQRIHMLTVLSIALVLSYQSQAQENFSLKSAKASVQGTSSLHDWESEITRIECKAQLKKDNQLLTSIKSAEVRILVKGIKSTKGKVMDNKTYDAFKDEENPDIIFAVNSGQIKTDASGNASLEASGNLTMAGVTRVVAVTAKGKTLPNGDVQITLSHKLKMTDYKMKPPTALMGTIVVGEEVTVNFDLILTPAAVQAKKI